MIDRRLHLVRPAESGPTLEQARAVIDRIRAERTELLIEKLGDVLSLAGDIADQEAGYAPGIRDGARRIVARLTGEQLTLKALHGRQHKEANR